MSRRHLPGILFLCAWGAKEIFQVVRYAATNTVFQEESEQSSCSYSLHREQEPHCILGARWFTSMCLMCLTRATASSGHKLLNLENKNDETIKGIRKYCLIFFSFEKVLFAQISIIYHFSLSIRGRKMESGIWIGRAIYFYRA